eukprot:CAMPEP_0170784930 /NCGR_PEP_ID=MMETSP0733-20121128/16544_1 /TAXON_ID=186038 /ORGANISM="Fragilariopsis kerguelensis, Strain L26-C5" /LENGTH=394 /DNA_ID=CAMNT_0011130167 /DNA_START=179 /DNA_END=1360 /DNA_ORIENTATION=+
MMMMASSFSFFTVNAFAPPVAQRLASVSFMSSFMKATDDHGEVDVDVDNDVVTAINTIQNRRELIKSLPGRTAALSAIVGGIASSGLIGDTIMPPSATAAAADTHVYPPGTKTGYGPLQDLIGTWTGNQGFTRVTVPGRGTEPNHRATNNAESFQIKEFPYEEEFVIEPVQEDALQVGGSIDQYSAVLKYHKKVWIAGTKPEGSNVIHQENGMFFYLPKIVNVGDESKPINPKDEAPYTLARSASIPHGNMAMMFGDVAIERTEGIGAPTIPTINTFPLPVRGDKKKISLAFLPVEALKLGYLKPNIEGLVKQPKKILEDAMEKNRPVKNYYQIKMTTDNKDGAGGLINTNFVNQRATTRAYSAHFWIEELENGKMQMQYYEDASILFHFFGRW